MRARHLNELQEVLPGRFGPRYERTSYRHYLKEDYTPPKSEASERVRASSLENERSISALLCPETRMQELRRLRNGDLKVYKGMLVQASVIRFINMCVCNIDQDKAIPRDPFSLPNKRYRLIPASTYSDTCENTDIFIETNPAVTGYHRRMRLQIKSDTRLPPNEPVVILKSFEEAVQYFVSKVISELQKDQLPDLFQENRVRYLFNHTISPLEISQGALVSQLVRYARTGIVTSKMENVIKYFKTNYKSMWGYFGRSCRLIKAMWDYEPNEFCIIIVNPNYINPPTLALPIVGKVNKESVARVIKDMVEQSPLVS